MLRLLVLFLFLSFCIHSQNVSIGDAATHLNIHAWAFQRPLDISLMDSSRPIVIGFFRTWCDFSRQSLSLFDQLSKQKQHQKFIWIAIYGESVKIVENDERIGVAKRVYIGIDKNNQTYQSYLYSRGIFSVPYIFIIGENGKIIWHGHPFEQFQNIFLSISNGNYALEKNNVVEKFDRKISQYYEALTKEMNGQQTVLENELLDDIEQVSYHPDILYSCSKLCSKIANNGNLFHKLNFAEKLALKIIQTFPKTESVEQSNEYYAYVYAATADIFNAKDSIMDAIEYQNLAIEYASSISLIEELKDKLDIYNIKAATKMGKSLSYENLYAELESKIYLYRSYITGGGNPIDCKRLEEEMIVLLQRLKKIYKYRENLYKELNSLAWDILTKDTTVIKNPQFALQIAKIACQLSREKEGYILDTYSLALFENGKIEDAIKMQEKAILFSSGPRDLEEFKQRLERYKTALPKQQKETTTEEVEIIKQIEETENDD